MRTRFAVFAVRPSMDTSRGHECHGKIGDIGAAYVDAQIVAFIARQLRDIAAAQIGSQGWMLGENQAPGAFAYLVPHEAGFLDIRFARGTELRGDQRQREAVALAIN